MGCHVLWHVRYASKIRKKIPSYLESWFFYLCLLNKLQIQLRWNWCCTCTPIHNPPPPTKKTTKKHEALRPRVAHLSDIATADMQMLCNIFPVLSSQLMKRSSFKQFFILKKKIYGMPVNWVWSFEQTLNGSQLGFTIGTILVIFDLRVTPMLPTKFWVNWPFSSGEEAKNRFLRWLPWRPSWISDWHDFSYFWSTSHPNVSYEVWSQLAFRCRRRS